MTGTQGERVQIVGRRSSHFTRVALIFAHELGVPFELVHVRDLTGDASALYAGNPALKIPVLRRGELIVFGTANICRTLAELGDGRARLVWPEALRDPRSRNAQELVWHGMAAQVQLIFGTLFAELPADNVYFAKGRTGLQGALAWLEENVESVLGELPSPRDLSLLEVTLFCLVEHLGFRRTVSLEAYPRLVRFAEEYAVRPSAKQTAHR